MQIYDCLKVNRVVCIKEDVSPWNLRIFDCSMKYLVWKAGEIQHVVITKLLY